MLRIQYAAASPRHCEPPGRANARPMTGSAKQSMARHAEIWIASSQVLLAMTVDTVSRSLGTMRPRFASNFCDLSNSEGAGNAGCALHPRSHAQCAQEVRA